VIFTGYRFDRGSCLRSQFWSTSVSTAWPHSIFRCTVSRRQSGIFDLLTLLDWLFHVPEQTTATVASLSNLGPRVWNLVFLLNCAHRTLYVGHVQKQTEGRRRCFSTRRLTLDSAHLQHSATLCYTNNNNNNNNNNRTTPTRSTGANFTLAK